jgi:translation initiation factor 4A
MSIKTVQTWEDETLDLKENLLRGIYSYGFEKPSPIQKTAVPTMVSETKEKKRRDIIAQAQSGTGKTGAFTVSTLQIIDENVKNTQALILAPTHELANQICSCVNELGRYLNVTVQLLVGGTSVDGDKNKLDNNTPHIVVGTPGRVHDMIRRKYFRVDDLKVLVLDEADEMLSTGFKEQMYKIFQFMPNNIQIGLFSATMPADLKMLTTKFMRNPNEILVKNDNLTLQGIAQYYISLDDDHQKYMTVKDLFSQLSIAQAIIYCNSTKRVDDLAQAMEEDGFPVKKIHGKMDEKERKDTHKEFKSGASRVLVTSDLFARGIDVQQVSIVINFDIPKSEHTYLHRIGRSGRWGRKGIAVNFTSKHDIQRLKKFEEYYQTQIVEMPNNYIEHLN